MPWGWVDDRHYRHAKLAELDEGLRKGCIALFWLAISWCNDQLTDGRVPAGAVRLLGGDPAEAEELVRVRLWERDGKGYRVHDFFDFNKSRDQVVAERAARHDLAVAGGTARAAEAPRVGGRFTSRPAGDTAGPAAGDAAGDTAGDLTSRNASRGPAPLPVTRTPLPVPRTPKVPAHARGTWAADISQDVRDAWHERFTWPPTAKQEKALRTFPSTWAVVAELIRAAPPKLKAFDVAGYVMDGLAVVVAEDRAADARQKATAKVNQSRAAGNPTQVGKLLSDLPFGETGPRSVLGGRS